MKNLLNKEDLNFIVRDYNHKCLQKIVMDYYLTYSTFNDNLGSVLRKIEDSTCCLITNVFKEHESSYIVITQEETYYIECKNGTWNFARQDNEEVVEF